MSKANRKGTYEKLVAAGRFKDISPALLEEFGSTFKEVEAPVVKKKRGKKSGK